MLIANKMQAAFMVAPMAMVLKSQGVPIRIVYLGHRYGSAVVVREDGPIKSFADMRGHTIAIPTRYSGERLRAYRAAKKYGECVDFLRRQRTGGIRRSHLHHLEFLGTSRFPPRRRWAATAGSSCTPGRSGPTICRACWWSGKT